MPAGVGSSLSLSLSANFGGAAHLTKRWNSKLWPCKPHSIPMAKFMIQSRSVLDHASCLRRICMQWGRARMISDMSTLNDFPWVSLNSCSSYGLTDKLICAKLTEMSGPSPVFLCKICNRQLKKETRNAFVSPTIRRDSRYSGSCAETCHES